jgi:hypothetical protein
MNVANVRIVAIEEEYGGLKSWTERLFGCVANANKYTVILVR